MPRKVPEASLANLKKGTPFKKGNSYAAKGGRASGKSKQRIKTMREALEVLLQLPWLDPNGNPLREVTSLAEAKGLNVTVLEKILLGQILAAAQGKTPAAVFIRDTLGQTFMPNKTGDEVGTEYEDDGFTAAIKASAVEVWGERHGHKKEAANKAGSKV